MLYLHNIYIYIKPTSKAYTYIYINKYIFKTCSKSNNSKQQEQQQQQDEETEAKALNKTPQERNEYIKYTPIYKYTPTRKYIYMHKKIYIHICIKESD